MSPSFSKVWFMFPSGRESRILTDHCKDVHTVTTLPFWEVAQTGGLKLLISYASGHNLFLNPCVIDFNLSNTSSLPVSFYNVTQKALSNPIYKRTFLGIKEKGYWVHVFSLVLKVCFICECFTGCLFPDIDSVWQLLYCQPKKISKKCQCPAVREANAQPWGILNSTRKVCIKTLAGYHKSLWTHRLSIKGQWKW